MTAAHIPGNMFIFLFFMANVTVTWTMIKSLHCCQVTVELEATRQRKCRGRFLVAQGGRVTLDTFSVKSESQHEFFGASCFHVFCSFYELFVVVNTAFIYASTCKGKTIQAH